jgi:hypothetical protein
MAQRRATDMVSMDSVCGGLEAREGDLDSEEFDS